jgi:hypothetical protein
VRPFHNYLPWALLCAFLVAGCGYKQPVSEVQNTLKGFVQKVGTDIQNKDAASAKKNCDEALAKSNLASHDRAAFERLSAECQAGNWEGAKDTMDRMMGVAK